MKNFKKIISLLLVVFIPLFAASCQKDAETTPSGITQQVPAVKSSGVADAKIIDDLFAGQRTPQSAGTVQAVYEGYEDYKVVYVPDIKDENKYTMHLYDKGVLVPEFILTMQIEDEKMVVTTPTGSRVTYNMKGGSVTGIEVFRNDETEVNGNPDTRKPGDGKKPPTRLKRVDDMFGSYIDCTDAVLDQASAWCGGCATAKVAFIAGCGYFPVCSGAYIFTCGLYAYTEFVK